MKTKNRTPQLKYQAIREQLMDIISDLEPGDRIPSERKLATDMDCSFLTVRKAMGTLVEQGVIVRRPGSGSFVGTGEQPEVQVETRRLGLLISPSCDSYALQIIAELGNEAEEHEYMLSSRMVSNFGSSAMAEAENLANEGCGALIIPWFAPDSLSDVASFAHNSPLPVCLPEFIPGLQDSFFETPALFGVNLIKGVENICRYFHLQGYSQIAYLGPNTPTSDVLQKNLSGYNNYICKHGLQPICALVESTPAAMDAKAREWQQMCPDLAIVCYDDDHAMRMITSMHKLGVNAPEDYVILGYGNTNMCSLSDPPLSSVYQDFSYTASWMLRNAKALSEGGCDQSQDLPRLRFAVRESCGGLKKWDDTKLEKMLHDSGFVLEK